MSLCFVLQSMFYFYNVLMFCSTVYEPLLRWPYFLLYSICSFLTVYLCLIPHCMFSYSILMFFHSVVSTLTVSLRCVPYFMFYLNIEIMFCSTGMECQIQQCRVQDRVRVWRPGRPHLRLSTCVMSSPLLHHHLIHHQTCHLNKKNLFLFKPLIWVFLVTHCFVWVKLMGKCTDNTYKLFMLKCREKKVCWSAFKHDELWN